MALEIERATPEQRSALEQLMQLYIYEFSDFVDLDVAADGFYDHEPIGDYWKEDGWAAYLIYVSDRLAGFVLTGTDPFLEYDEPVTCIAEFFILRRYRGKGFGRRVAFHLFDSTPGRWEVFEMEGNMPAQKFWRRIVNQYTGGDFDEIELDDPPGHVQTFLSGAASAAVPAR